MLDYCSMSLHFQQNGWCSSSDGWREAEVQKVELELSAADVPNSISGLSYYF